MGILSCLRLTGYAAAIALTIASPGPVDAETSPPASGGAGEKAAGGGQAGNESSGQGESSKGGHSSKAGSAGDTAEKGNDDKPRLSPEQKMERRLPQPVRAGYLVGLPILGETNAILARVQSVVRAPDGKIRLVAPYGGLFGIGSRLVAIPVEVVAMLGKQVVAVDMPDAEFETTPTWYGSGAETLPPDTVVRVGVMRR